MTALEQVAMAGLSFSHAARESRRAAAWLPWALVLGAGALALAALAWCAHPLLSWFMAPLLRAFTGEESLRYPGLFRELPRMAAYVRFLLNGVVVPVACGGSVLGFAALYGGMDPEAGGILRESLRRSPAFVLAALPAWLAEAGLRAGLAALPGIRLASMTRALAPYAADVLLVLVRAAFFYVIVHTALERRGPVAALVSVRDSLRSGFLPALLTLVALGLPLAAMDALVAGPLAAFALRVPEAALLFAGVRNLLGAIAGVLACGTATLVWMSALAPRDAA